MMRLDDIVLGQAEPPPLILILEDDPPSREMYVRCVEGAGYETAAVDSAPDALSYIERFGLPNLALVDLSLNGRETGFDFVARLHEVSDVPIIFISGDDRQDTIVTGLDRFGADYIVKPVNQRELVARIKRELRRTGERSRRTAVVHVGGLAVDFFARAVYKEGGEEVTLTPIESKLLYLLHRNRGSTVPSGRLIQAVWNANDSPTWRSNVRVHIFKLKALGFAVRTDHGVGYYLE